MSRVEASATAPSGSVGLAGLVFLAFLVLKLTHVIDWSWWWITAPLWGGLALLLVFVVLGIAVAGIFAGIGEIARLRRLRAAKKRLKARR